MGGRNENKLCPENRFSSSFFQNSNDLSDLHRDGVSGVRHLSDGMV
jgi:hypothetical protein